MEVGAGAAIEVAKAITEVFAGKSMSVTCPRLATDQYKCEKQKGCLWQEKRHEWNILRRYFWPFKKWGAAELWVYLDFQYDGCDVANARISPCGKSYNRWLNDKSTYNLVATGGTSKIGDQSGCKACCEQAAVLTLEVTVDVSEDWGRSHPLFFDVEISGNGRFTIAPR